jgi:hypothetical protein
MTDPLFDEDDFDGFDTLEDRLDHLLDSPTDFDEYVVNEDDCA